MKIGLLGFGNPILFVAKTLQAAGVEIVGVQQDFDRKGTEQLRFEEQLKVIAAPLMSRLERTELDAVFVMNYNRIIDVSQYPGVKLINLHMGILPVWRGNSANSWAVLNGEDQIGYTLHEVSEQLDAGPIYYTCEIPVDLNTAYGVAREGIYDDISQNLARIIKDIVAGTRKPVSQEGSSFVYCAKIRKRDGSISTWNVNTEYLLRKHYLFGPPGTGLYFEFKGKTYHVGHLSEVRNFMPSLGVPGSIVYIKGGAIWVKVKDTAIALNDLTINGASIITHEHFKIGNRLPNKND